MIIYNLLIKISNF